MLYIGRFKKKPVVIDAVKFDGSKKHAQEIIEWMRESGGVSSLIGPEIVDEKKYFYIEILTLEGLMKTNPEDWVIRGIKGEFYPCKPDIFDGSYERA